MAKRRCFALSDPSIRLRKTAVRTRAWVLVLLVCLVAVLPLDARASGAPVRTPFARHVLRLARDASIRGAFVVAIGQVDLVAPKAERPRMPWVAAWTLGYGYHVNTSVAAPLRDDLSVRLVERGELIHHTETWHSIDNGKLSWTADNCGRHRENMALQFAAPAKGESILPGVPAGAESVKFAGITEYSGRRAWRLRIRYKAVNPSYFGSIVGGAAKGVSGWLLVSTKTHLPLSFRLAQGVWVKEVATYAVTFSVRYVRYHQHLKLPRPPRDCPKI